MTDQRHPLRRFFSGLGRILSVTRSIISGLISLVFILVFLALLGSLIGERGLSVPEQGALRLDLNGTLVDQRSYADPLTQLINPNAPGEFVVRELEAALLHAAEDDRIQAVFLLLHDFQGGGTSKIDELGAALLQFRASGKPVIALADNYSQQQYLFASYASEIILHPMGMVDVRGFAAYQPYLGEALEKLSVNLHVFRTGEYKDAVEPLIASSMSQASRTQNQMLLDDLWQTYAGGVSERRQLSRERFDRYVNQLDQVLLEAAGDSAQAALEAGLVDRVMSRDDSLAYSIKLAGANPEGDFYSHINLGAYYQIEGLATRPDRRPQIGLIVASGTIVDGSPGAGAIGGDSLAYLLRQTRLNEDLAALVLRVDSPGGSAFASELIRNELQLFQRQGIPVVVSMGSVAASGGYWIATASDHIVATPATITGSIGVFSLFPTLEDSLARIGVYSDGVQTAPFSDAMQLDRPLSEAASQVIQARVDFIYRQFLDLVSEARSIPTADLEPLAGGRVWTGRQGLELGLVDSLGDLDDATRRAAELAGITDYQVHEIEPPLSFAEQLTRVISQGVSTLASDRPALLSRLQTWLGTSLPASALSLNDPQGLFLYCVLCTAGSSL